MDWNTRPASSKDEGGDHSRRGSIRRSSTARKTGLSWRARLKWVPPSVMILLMLYSSSRTLPHFADKWDELLTTPSAGDDDHSSVDKLLPIPLVSETPRQRLNNRPLPAKSPLSTPKHSRTRPAKTPLYTPKVRYLFGILTATGEKEKIRRRVIRSTYLSFYKQQYVGYPLGDENVICSIQELRQDFHSQQKRHKYPDCQIVYTFVAAAGDPRSAPTERMHHNHKDPFTLQSAPEHSNMSSWFNNETDDITYLNIKENMNEGKSQTWFKYGVMVAAQLGIDYIAKLDSDAIVWPSCFLKQMEQRNVTKVLALPSSKSLINHSHQKSMKNPYRPDKTSLYAGFSWRINPNCKGQHEFYSGMFYLMSTDVAQDVTRAACPRHNLLYSIARLRRSKCSKFTIQKHFANSCKYGISSMVHSGHVWTKE
jgi:Galactosyltransferase